LARRGLYSLSKLNNHHELPQEQVLQQRFSEKGLNINDSQFIKTVPRYLHEDIHSGLYTGGVKYNDVWYAFFAKYPTAEKAEILEFLEELRAVMPY
jgi:hypothetical protein